MTTQTRSSTYALTMKPAYLSDVVGLPRNVARRLQTVLEELEKDPTRTGGHIKKLTNFKNLYRYRIDDHRLIYAVGIEVRCVDLLAIGVRRDVYDRLGRTPRLPMAPIGPVEVYEEKPVEETDPLDGFVPVPVVSEVLPEYSANDLTAWRIPEEFQGALLECRTETCLLDSSVPDEWKNRLIDRLFPRPIAEVQTQPSLVLQTPEDMSRFVEGDLSSFLLQMDSDQEALVSRNLRGPTLVKGGPGSGKSTVALYRVKALVAGGYAQGRVPSILFTTFTNALTAVSEQLLQQLLGERPYELDVKTVDSVAMGLLAGGERVDPAGDGDRRKALVQARAELLGDDGDLDAFLENAAFEELPLSYLQEEIDWCIEGMELDTLDAYLGAVRIGRGIALDRSLRRRVWRLYEGYSQRLAKQGNSTWGAVRLRALRRVQSDPGLRRYDYVLVDEAQDLTPVALRLCVSLCREPAGLFVTADAGQSLYNRGFSWTRVHSDLKFAGRTRILRRNYRSTRQIGVAAADFLGRQAGDIETTEQAFVRDGAKPVLGICRDRAQQIAWLARQIREGARLLQLGLGACAVLCSTRKLAQEAAQALRTHGLKADFVEGSSVRVDSPAVKVMTMHAAKGLEFALVGLPALEVGVMPLPMENNDDKEAHDGAQRRLVHVAASRAMRLLFATTTSGVESPYLQDLTEDHWEKEDAS